MNHVPGKELYIADTLLRMQLRNPDKTSMIPEPEMNIYVDSIADSLPVSDAKLIEMRESQDYQDPVWKKFRVAVEKAGGKSSPFTYAKAL